MSKPFAKTTVGVRLYGRCKLCPYRLLAPTDTGLDKQKFQRKIVNFFLPMNFNICFGCSKEPFEYPQHMFWLRNKKIKFSLLNLYQSPKEDYLSIVCDWVNRLAQSIRESPS